jgi:hypothetical protein
MTTQNYFERETWLAAAAVLLQHEVFPAAGIDASAWENRRYRVGCGFPIGYRGSKNAARTGIVLGQAFDPAVSADGTYEVFINPLIDNPEAVIGVLAHELVHVWVGIQCGHRGDFVRVAREIGLVGPAPCTVPGEALSATIREIAATLGAYPHASIDPSLRKKQGTRLLKLECEECGWVARVSLAQGRRIHANAPCPVCHANGALHLHT